jgi:hypothetical protein
VPLGPRSRVGEVLKNPAARSIAGKAFPGFFDSPLLEQASGLSLEFLAPRMIELRSTVPHPGREFVALRLTAIGDGRV